MADIAIEEAIADFRRLSGVDVSVTHEIPKNVEKTSQDEVGSHSTQPAKDEVDDDSQCPKGIQLFLLTISVGIVLIVLGLDISIVAVTVPALSDAFHSIEDIAWYSTALRLVMCSFMFMFGKAYTLFSVKWLFILSLATFEVGNVLCTFAQSSAMFIVGRAICGFGASGLSGGAFTVVTHCFPLRQRALIGGIGGVVEALASMASPIIGGALITNWTWRACFGINIPLGAIGCGMLFMFLKIHPNPDESLTLREKLRKLDLIGTAIFAPAIVCLLLALQWGGTVYRWGDARIIVLLVLSGALMVAFLLIQWKSGEMASIPFRILRNRSLLAGSFFAMCCNVTIATVEYYMSIYFQGVRGYSAVKTGLFALPMIGGLCIAAPLAGTFTTLVGYYYPTMYVATVLIAIGVGVLTTLDLHTNIALVLCMIGVIGFGVGSGIQGPQVAAQTVLPTREVSIGIAIVQFGSQIGPVIFIAASTALFSNQLHKEIGAASLSTNATLFDGNGLTDIRNIVSPNSLPDVLRGFNAALVQTLYLPLAVACVSIVGAVLMERKSVKDKKKKNTMTTNSLRDKVESLNEKKDVTNMEVDGNAKHHT